MGRHDDLAARSFAARIVSSRSAVLALFKRLLEDRKKRLTGDMAWPATSVDANYLRREAMEFKAVVGKPCS
jgi:hypothetical protein